MISFLIGRTFTNRKRVEVPYRTNELVVGWSERLDLPSVEGTLLVTVEPVILVVILTLELIN